MAGSQSWKPHLHPAALVCASNSAYFLVETGTLRLCIRRGPRPIQSFKTHRGNFLFRLKVARTAREIDELRFAWDSLFCPPLSMFQSFQWNRLAAETFADREVPYFILAESDGGAAIVPAVVNLESKTIGFAGERLFDYRDYLALGDAPPLRRAWHHLAKLNLPLSITAINRPDAAVWNGFPRTPFSSAPQLKTHEITAGDFASSHPRAFSRLRKLERMGLRLGRYAGRSPIVRQIYERRARQSGDGELFRDQKRVEFMVAICREMDSTCEVFTLEHSNTLPAAVVTFRDANFRRFYTTYYDRQWARYSPGVSLLFEVARHSLEQGLDIDLMTGEQSYKMRIASTAQPLYHVNASATQMRAALPDVLREVAA